MSKKLKKKNRKMPKQINKKRIKHTMAKTTLKKRTEPQIPQPSEKQKNSQNHQLGGDIVRDKIPEKEQTYTEIKLECDNPRCKESVLLSEELSIVADNIENGESHERDITAENESDLNKADSSNEGKSLSIPNEPQQIILPREVISHPIVQIKEVISQPTIQINSGIGVDTVPRALINQEIISLNEVSNNSENIEDSPPLDFNENLPFNGLDAIPLQNDLENEEILINLENIRSIRTNDDSNIRANDDSSIRANEHSSIRTNDDVIFHGNDGMALPESNVNNSSLSALSTNQSIQSFLHVGHFSNISTNDTSTNAGHNMSSNYNTND